MTKRRTPSLAQLHQLKNTLEAVLAPEAGRNHAGRFVGGELAREAGRKGGLRKASRDAITPTTITEAAIVDILRRLSALEALVARLNRP